MGLEPIAPGEVDQRFGHAFTIQRIVGTDTPQPWRLIPGFAAYLMTRAH
ncbi:MAG TPA: hypothetical protein VG276_14855 [Actinomycetes bacterium]|jgi:hypothetical protein|nr:hypothetical protein [Actinomycetes bacterium]